VAAVLALAAPSADAHFERLYVSSRAFSMGGAFVSVADDPSAVIYNPAGLTQIPTASVLTTISHPYGLADLGEYVLAGAIPTRIGTFGVSWHRFSLSDVASEDLFTIAYGRDLIRTSQDASLSVGGAVDISRAAYPELSQSQTVVSGVLSVLLRPFPVIGLGYTVRNLGEPTFDFAAGGRDANTWAGPSPLEMVHAFGLAYHWDRRVSILYERERGQDGKWRDRLGLEVKAGETLRLRSGLYDGSVTGGIGVHVSRVLIDAGVVSHEMLGLTYLISVGISLPEPEGEGVGEW
jgi:hypothetical protein